MRVEVHSGYGYAERPTAVWWEGERLEIEAIEQEWRTPEGKHFRARAMNGMVFELRYGEVPDEWQVRLVN